MNNKKQVKLIIPCRFAYLNCWSPVSINGGEEKYSICAIISKKDTETLEKHWKKSQMLLKKLRKTT